MRSRVVNEFVKTLSIFLMRLTPTRGLTEFAELKQGLSVLIEAIKTNEDNFKLTDDADLLDQKKELENQIVIADEIYKKSLIENEEKIAKINYQIQLINKKVAETIQMKQLANTSDLAEFAELGIEPIKDHELKANIKDEKYCSHLYYFFCPPKKAINERTTDKIEDHVNFLNSRRAKLEDIRNKLSTPAKKTSDILKTALGRVQLKIDQDEFKQLSSVSINTIEQVVNVYKTYLHFLHKAAIVSPDLLIAYMDKLTCRDVDFQSAWLFYQIDAERKSLRLRS